MVYRKRLLCAFLAIYRVHGWTIRTVVRHNEERAISNGSSIRSSSSRRITGSMTQRRRPVLSSSSPVSASKSPVESTPIVKEIQHTSNPTAADQSSFHTNTTRTTLAVEPTRLGWEARTRELAAFVEIHGHARVPKRYSVNPGLGNWVNKQRQHYRNYHAGTKPCSLTEARIDILNSLGFCWDARGKSNGQSGSSITADATTQSFDQEEEAVPESWWGRLEELRDSISQQDDKSNTSIETPFVAILPRHSSLGAWFYRQRQAYCQGLLHEDQVQALDEVSGGSRMVWTATRRDWQWQVRFQELVDYKAQHGDCCVPISHKNKQLAHWVSNQRKQYNLLMANKKSSSSSSKKASTLTRDRLERLQAIGFVWDRWEYEFSQKQVRESD